MYLISFSIGFSSTPWAVNSEIYPIHLIGTASAMATCTNWISNYAISSVFVSVLKLKEGKVIAFLPLAAFAGLAWLFIYFLLPETNGLTIQENLTNVMTRNINGKKQDAHNKHESYKVNTIN